MFVRIINLYLNNKKIQAKNWKLIKFIDILAPSKEPYKTYKYESKEITKSGSGKQKVHF